MLPNEGHVPGWTFQDPLLLHQNLQRQKNNGPHEWKGEPVFPLVLLCGLRWQVGQSVAGHAQYHCLKHLAEQKRSLKSAISEYWIRSKRSVINQRWSSKHKTGCESYFWKTGQHCQPNRRQIRTAKRAHSQPIEWIEWKWMIGSMILFNYLLWHIIKV